MATVSPPWAYTLQLPHDPRAPGIARSTLRAVLRAHRMTELTETAELLASELVTNAHQYSREPCGLRLRAPEPHRLRLGVWDANPEIPPPFKGALSPPGAEAERGRGLHLVQLCADTWGAHPLKFGGKLLWVECRGEESGRTR
ncbi:ATP-binding protein [Streptomyces sp. NBC_01481]|uniref:ATP-binding protein n=1 Tax=Streptomyces sp. NBC_01481 TaxID=2975869 RepID=UPI002256046E|nr:ATP-binding protein [Streptomyces sp. NBC_01481]MCX4584366.1 ATP-binding protein [Streptomyces sp. NBC_01481]